MGSGKKKAASGSPAERQKTEVVKENGPVTVKDEVVAGSKAKKSSSLTTSLSFLVVLLALAVGVFYNQKRLTPPSPRPATSEMSELDKKNLSKNVMSLSPSTEMSRGYPNTLQSKLYEGVDPAVLLIMNDDDKENIVMIYFKGEPKAVAPAGSRSRIESFLGHEFQIKTKSKVVDLVVEAPFQAYKVKKDDGSVQKLDVRNEDQIPKLDLPPLKIVPLSSTAKAIKVRNLSGKRFNSYWVPENGGALVYQGVVEPNSESTTTSYLTHTFRFTELKDKNKVVFEFSVNAEDEIYAFVDEKTADKAKLQSHREEVAFAKEYKRKHDGRPWLSYYPHEPVKSFMWPADYIGQEYRLRTDHGPGDKPMNFTLKVVSVRPRVFEVDYFISEEEGKHIIETARARMRRSSVEIHGENGEIVESDTRTSKNAWLERGPSGSVLDSVYRRVADLLNVPESILTHNPPNGAAENMQVVSYKNSAHYAPHHDWGVRGGPHTRLSTVLLYLHEPVVGGETAFPLAKVGKPEGLVVKVKKGKAVLFYSQFPDGNVDDESLHEARPVTKGEKIMANIWTHDRVYWREQGM